MRRYLELCAYVSAALSLSSAEGLAEERVLNLINKSGKAITGFFVTPDNFEASTINMIGSSGLGAAQSVEINIPSSADACVFDLKIAFQDDSVEDRPDVDFCSVDGYVIE
jgi:hypothetical protein